MKKQNFASHLLKFILNDLFPFKTNYYPYFLFLYAFLYGFIIQVAMSRNYRLILPIKKWIWFLNLFYYTGPSIPFFFYDLSLLTFRISYILGFADGILVGTGQYVSLFITFPTIFFCLFPTNWLQKFDQTESFDQTKGDGVFVLQETYGVPCFHYVNSYCFSMARSINFNGAAKWCYSNLLLINLNIFTKRYVSSTPWLPRVQFI